jgi:hypothetical protein
LRIKVHVPVLGKPFNMMIPVETVQVGWAMALIVGALGLPTDGLMTTFAVGKDPQPAVNCTVKV